jgi:hypothetical protein
MEMGISRDVIVCFLQWQGWFYERRIFILERNNMGMISLHGPSIGVADGIVLAQTKEKWSRNCSFTGEGAQVKEIFMKL